MMFHPKHVLIKDEFQKHRLDHQSDILLRAATKHVLIKDEFQKHRLDHQSDILLRAATKFW